MDDRVDVFEVLVASAFQASTSDGRRVIDAASKSGLTPLAMVTDGGKRDFIKLLIENRAFLYIGALPLLGYAIDKRNDLSFLEFILQVAPPGHINAGYQTDALSVAVYDSQLDTVRFLLKHGADPNIQIHPSSRSVLYKATEIQNVEIVTLFLEYKANINFCAHGISCPTCLHVAARHNNDKLVRLLLHHGADGNLVNTFNGTPAYKYGCFATFLEFGCPVKAYNTTTLKELEFYIDFDYNMCEEIICFSQVLEDANDEPDFFVDYHHQMPFVAKPVELVLGAHHLLRCHYGLRHEHHQKTIHRRMIKGLHAVSRVNCENWFEKGVLIGNADLALANFNAADHAHWTTKPQDLLRRALIDCQFELFRGIIQECEYNIGMSIPPSISSSKVLRTQQQWTLMHDSVLIAAHWKLTENLVRQLRFLVSEIHADVNAVDSDGRTPLMIACLLLETPALMVSTLLQLGARVNASSNTGCTALDYLRLQGEDQDWHLHSHQSGQELIARHEEKTMLLLQAGGVRGQDLNPDRTWDEGDSMLMEAAKQGLFRVVAYLEKQYREAVNNSNA